MFSSRFWSLVSVVFHLSIHIADSYNVSSSNSTCVVDYYSCEISGRSPTYYGWTDLNSYNFPFGPLPETVTMTSTIVTVIDTLRGTTSTSTKYPDDYTPVPTNAGGTRVEYVTYLSGSESVTTTLVFPTFFLNWPDEYEWTGSMLVTDKGGATRCVTAPEGGVTVPITSKPLLTGPSASSIWTEVMNYKSGYDPRGLTFVLVADWAEYWEYSVYSTQFPNQPAITSCKPEGEGPGWGAFTQTAWTTDTSTSYASSATSPSSTSPSSKTRPKTSIKSNTEATSSMTEAIPSTSESSASPPKTTASDTSSIISSYTTKSHSSLADITTTSAAGGSSSGASSTSSGALQGVTATTTDSSIESTGVSGVISSSFVVGTLPITSDTTASGSETQVTGFSSTAGTTGTSSMSSFVTAKGPRGFKAPLSLSFGYFIVSVILAVFM